MNDACLLLARACLSTSHRCSSGGGGVVKPAVARVPEPDRCDGRDRDMPRDVPSHEGAEAAAPGFGSSKRPRRGLRLVRAARLGTGGPSSREQPRAMVFAGGQADVAPHSHDGAVDHDDDRPAARAAVSAARGVWARDRRATPPRWRAVSASCARPRTRGRARRCTRS